MSTSHDLARNLQQTAEFLLAREAFELVFTPLLYVAFSYKKEEFIASVRATIPGQKRITDYSVEFHPQGTMLTLSVDRSAVCRKVQDVKWECEPLLSPQEESQMDVES